MFDYRYGEEKSFGLRSRALSHDVLTPPVPANQERGGAAEEVVELAEEVTEITEAR